MFPYCFDILGSVLRLSALPFVLFFFISLSQIVLDAFGSGL